MNNKVRAVLHGIVEKFRTGDIPGVIAYSMFPTCHVPSTKWSFLNRFVMIMSNTRDARGIRQWNQVGRWVMPGSKAIYILVPRLVKTNDLRNDEVTQVLKGFLAKPVFRVEDTDGKPLDYQEDIPLPDFPLMERAKAWGVTIKGVSGNLGAYGAYDSRKKAIQIATSEEAVFFHELAHAAHERLVGKLEDGQTWNQEIVAELSAQVLCRLVGSTMSSTLGNSYRYIDIYARKAGLHPVTACLRVIEDVEKVLTLILGSEEQTETKSSLTGGNDHVERTDTGTTETHPGAL